MQHPIDSGGSSRNEGEKVKPCERAGDVWLTEWSQRSKIPTQDMKFKGRP